MSKRSIEWRYRPYIIISFISIFSFFLVFKHVLSDALILQASQLQTQQVITLQYKLGPHRIFNTDFCSFVVEIDEKI